MRTFEHINAYTIEDVCRALTAGVDKVRLNAGGTDLLGTLKDDILPHFPEVIVNLKTIEGLDYIKEEDGLLKVGALAKLADLISSPIIREKYDVIAQACRTVASPQIRNVATIGGNLCQEVRCWYYRYPRQIGGPIGCARKGNGPCLAVKGDNRYHAIMGGKRCFAVCPSDTATALAALDADVKLVSLQGERTVSIRDFYEPLGNVLKPGEMVAEIRVPKPPEDSRQHFSKFTLRKPIDFAIVSVASVITVKDNLCVDARLALGGVAPMPVRAVEAEMAIKGKALGEALAQKGAEETIAKAKPLSRNAYKIEIAKTLIRRALTD